MKKQKAENATKIHPDTESSTSSVALSENLKLKIQNENENQLEELKRLELDSLNNKDVTCSARPLVDRTLKPVDKRGSSFYNFRQISIPVDLTTKFLECAEVNTNRNIETCGILAGKLVRL